MGISEADSRHITVMQAETVELLAVENGSLFVDATFGLGGHTAAILEGNPKAQVIGIDQDSIALAMATERLGYAAKRVRFCHGNFADIKTIVRGEGFENVDGIVADLGLSSMQVDSEERGFSFRFDAELDMRMDADSDYETAAELLERLTEEEIANVIYQFGEERASRKIARRIVEAKKAGSPVQTTFELKKLVESVVRYNPKEGIHPATRTFQAIRIAVNRELDVLATFLDDSIDLLNTGGRLAVISFHSLEDRIVKQTFHRRAGKCQCPPKIPKCVCGAAKEVEILTRKPMIPGDDEIRRNPRSRSAKLRAVEKLG
jgi:16S rRNA (cytosine1402-N4)-methyltransferase